MARSITFRRVTNPFQAQLTKDAKTINASKALYVPADKTTNIYKVDVKNYEKLLQDNITAKYQKTDQDTKNSINIEAKHIAEKLQLDDRIEQAAEQKAFITIKDHKPNFPNNIKCRLINPTKSNLGKVSKQILETINMKIRQSTGLLQWRNTPAVISWFKNIPYKERYKFLSFDVIDFYPSISDKLLSDAISFAKQFVEICQDDINIIRHCRKSLLFSKDSTWIKNNGSLFDVTMGSYDGAEVCELVGLFILYTLSQIVGVNNIGLYRDDGLAILENSSGPESERMKKNIINVFQQHGLKITADTNLIQTNFLDVTFNLTSGKYWPYRKPNDQPLYIHQKSNHPPTIKKQLPTMLANRLSMLSCNQEEFNKAIPDYNAAIEQSGHSSGLQYSDVQEPTRRKNRKRNIVWFNPPFSENVETNIGRTFLRLLNKHFPIHHRLHKICNKNNVKVSYSCLPNMAAIISRHNKTLLDNKFNPTKATPPCNCRNKTSCPLKGKCRESSIIYKATLTTDSTTKNYYGCSETEFKTRYYNHKQSFTNRKKQYATELSKAFWQATDEGQHPCIKWNIAARTKPYKPGTRRCNLCLEEKLAILKADPSTLLNKRTELYGKCRHKNKFKLKNVL